MVILGGALWDGTREDRVRDAAIRSEDGRIVFAGHREHADLSTADVVDLGDVTLMPGLINAHGHLGLDAGPDIMATWQHDDDGRLLLRMAGAAQRALRSGTTTFLEMGARNYLSVTLRDAIAEGLLEGPRLVVCAQQLTTPGGQGHDWGAIEVSSEGEIRRAAEELLDSGADFLKIMVGGGRITPSSNPRATQFDVSSIRVAVEVAHSRGARVAAHAHSTESIRRAVLAGCDSVEHASWYGEEEGIDYAEDVVQLIVDRGTFVAPTLSVSFPRAAPDYGSRHPLLGSLEERLGIVRKMHEAGVRLVAGSDAGAWFTHVEDFPHEIVLLHEAGLSAVQALRAATFDAAECIGLGAELGTLEPGKRADILAVEGNPLADIASLFSVSAVFKDGQRAC
jgi:imidazolonepropionase-like amidohydrolase